MSSADTYKLMLDDKKRSETNSKLTDKVAKKVFDQAMDLADRSVDPEEQTKNDAALRRAEERFTYLIDELAPDFCYGYTARANVRVSLGNYDDAVADYQAALKLAPLVKDAWLTRLNLGNTLIAVGQKEEGLAEVSRAVEQSKADKLALLGRGSALHSMGRYREASRDYGEVLTKNPNDVQPFWLRYALELYEDGEKNEAFGIARRLAGKYDIEPETNLAVCTLLWRDGTESARQEALLRYSRQPVVTKERMTKVDFERQEWPPASRAAAKEFLAAVAPPEAPPTGVAEASPVPSPVAPPARLAEPAASTPEAQAVLPVVTSSDGDRGATSDTSSGMAAE
jgi:tetratricopeptide (TPR) repeat protein